MLVHAGYRTDGEDNRCENITNALAAFLVVRRSKLTVAGSHSSLHATAICKIIDL
eukprot:COSAG03_NODE_107_length_12621_cov_360.337087_9_plen_55_part_00